MPFVSYRLLVLFGKSFVIFHIIGIIIIDIVCYYQNKAARAQPQTLPPQHQLQKMLTFFSFGGDVVFLVSWVSASVHLGSGTKRAEGSALTISVAHCTGTLHTGTQPPEPTPRFPSCSQTCARATSPQPLCDPFRARQVFVCCVWNFANFFWIYPNTRFCICDLGLCRIDSEAKCNIFLCSDIDNWQTLRESFC